MFNIDEIKLLCDQDFGSFYMSPKSTYEYILYGDIDYFEILVEEPLDQWIKKLKRIEYKLTQDGLIVYFKDELFELHVKSLKTTIITYLDSFDFNINGVSIRVSDDTTYKTFACYQEKYCASWVDPNDLRTSIKDGLIKPIHLDTLAGNGNKIFKMLSKMVDLNLDLDHETSLELKQNTYELEGDVTSYFLNILNYKHSYYYLVLLDELGLLSKAYPLVEVMKDRLIWDQDLKHLKIFEDLLLRSDVFSDGVDRVVTQTMGMKFECGLSKVQMLKISILFYRAHEVMLLKMNAPERYEKKYTSFCDQFGFRKEACRYYSMIIKSSQNASIALKKELSLMEQYNFFEEFDDNSVDVLLILLVHTLSEKGSIEGFESLVQTYRSKYLEIQSINSEITTMDINRHTLSDVNLTLLIEEVKEKIFFGNLRYDRHTIINYLQKLIEQS